MGNVKFTFDSDGLVSSIKSIVNEYLSSLSDSVRQTVTVEIDRITQRTLDLGVLAIAGDQLAAETLKDIHAQALLLLGAKSDDEFSRVIHTAKLIITTVLRTILAAAVSGLPV